MLMTTKLGNVVTYHNALLSITTYDLIITWIGSYYKLKKLYLALLPECLWIINLAKWGYAMRNTYS